MLAYPDETNQSLEVSKDFTTPGVTGENTNNSIQEREEEGEDGQAFGDQMIQRDVAHTVIAASFDRQVKNNLQLLPLDKRDSLAQAIETQNTNKTSLRSGMKSMKLTSSLLLVDEENAKNQDKTSKKQLSSQKSRSSQSSKRPTIMAHKRVSSSPYISLGMFSHCRSLSQFGGNLQHTFRAGGGAGLSQAKPSITQSAKTDGETVLFDLNDSGQVLRVTEVAADKESFIDDQFNHATINQ